MIHVTSHAVLRFQERVQNLPAETVKAILTGPTFQIAADFGARCVILPHGQRAVIQHHAVITILPARHRRHKACRIATNITWGDETP